MEGWVKIHRGMLDWEWYGDTNVVRLFFHLLLKANYEEKRWQGNIVGRGQLVTGRVELAEQTGLTEQQVRTALSKLKSTGEITIKTTNKYSVITICNYARYQDTEQQCQPTEQPTNNQQTTNKQPTNNQQITTTQEIKKERNKENNILPPYIPPRGDCEPACENFTEEVEVVPNHDTTQTTLPLNDTASPLEKEKSSAKKEKEPKHKYGQFENVLLTDKEAQKLHDEYGDDAVGIVEHLSAYKAEKNYKTKSDYLTIKRWVVSAYYEHQKRNSYGNIRTSVSDIPTERIVEAGRAWANI